MADYSCAFSSTLISGNFACTQAEDVVRRGGPDIACNSDAAHRRCEQLFLMMKQVALPAFGVEDDLLTMPHSVSVKIQFGGLLGLQRFLDNAAIASVKVDDIHALVDRAVENQGSLEAIPCRTFVEDMTSCQLKRRR